MNLAIFKRTKAEELSLETIIEPSTHTVRHLTHLVVDYLLACSRTATVLQTDRARLTALQRAVETSPDREHVAVIYGRPGESTPPVMGSPTNQEERWGILEAYRGYLDKKPETYEDQFFRSIYAMSAVCMMNDFIRTGIPESKVKAASNGQKKYYGQMWEASQRENPEEYARAWDARKEHLEKNPPPSVTAIDAVKSAYELMDTILTTEKPPSLTVDITMEHAQRIQASEEAQLRLMEFSVQVPHLDQDRTWKKFSWKVKSVETSRRQMRFFWVQFSALSDPTDEELEISFVLEQDYTGSQIRVNEEDFVGLLCRSDMQPKVAPAEVTSV